jgi:cytochrome P450
LQSNDIFLGFCFSDTIWRRHRKILNPTFNLKILESFLPIFVEKSRQLAEDMGKNVDNADFNVMDITIKYTLEAVFGE